MARLCLDQTPPLLVFRPWGSPGHRILSAVISLLILLEPRELHSKFPFRLQSVACIASNSEKTNEVEIASPFMYKGLHIKWSSKGNGTLMYWLTACMCAPKLFWDNICSFHSSRPSCESIQQIFRRKCWVSINDGQKKMKWESPFDVDATVMIM